MKDLVIQMKSISKTFGNIHALTDVSLEVQKGSVHALIGENGAGKTTLMSILYGIFKPEVGQIKVHDEVVSFHSSHDALFKRIGMVSQHYSIIGELSCLENLILGAEPSMFVNVKKAKKIAESLAKQMNFEFDWDAKASTLSPAAAQKLEILKLLWRKAEVMILDEPTAMLSPADSDQLFTSLKELTKKGATVILITHRLPEVMQHCDRATVLRQGKKIVDVEIKDTNAHQLAENIVGHQINPIEKKHIDFPQTMLKINNLLVKGYRGEDALKDVNLEVKAGEMLGIAGVDGNGQRELFHALMGVMNCQSGSIILDNDEITKKTCRQRIVSGMRLIPEDRLIEGVVEDWTLSENASLGLQRLDPLKNGHLVRMDAREELANRVIKLFGTKCEGLQANMSSLSGGNQQRFVSARALQYNPKLILAFQPTRGLDIDGTSQVYQAIREECLKGASAIIVSFDLDELLEECDRVVAMNHGRIHIPPPGSEKDRKIIGQLMVGAA